MNQSPAVPATDAPGARPRRLFLSPLLVSLLAALSGSLGAFFVFKRLSDRATELASGLGFAVVAMATLVGGGMYLMVAMLTQLIIAVCGTRPVTPRRVLAISTLVATGVVALAAMMVTLTQDPGAIAGALVLAGLVLAPILTLVAVGWAVCTFTVWQQQPDAGSASSPSDTPVSDLAGQH